MSRDRNILRSGTPIGYPKNPILYVQEDIVLPESGLLLLVGQNGAGKTTLLKYLAGCINGARPSIGSTVYLPERLDFPTFLTAKHLAMACLTDDVRQQFELDVKVLNLDLRKEYSKLSKGNQQKLILALSVARAIQLKAQMLLLDEPLSGLDFLVQQAAWSLFHRERSRRLVIASMHPDHIAESPDWLLVVADGTLRVAQGTFSDWREIEPILTASETCSA